MITIARAKTVGRICLIGCLIVVGATFVACSTSDAQDDADSAEVEAMTDAKVASFSNPQAVSILGYTQDAMEPFISRDGNFLFFNNSNDPSVDTNLFWATRVDDLTFQFQGQIAGVNSTSLDGVASMDVNDNFFFISTRSYATNFSTVYSGAFSNGSVTGAAVVPGVSAMKRGLVDFDEEISADGNTLYFTEGAFSGGAVPDSSTVMIARRNGDSFVRDASSKKLLKNLNNAGRLNYAAATSANQLEIFFTRFSKNAPAIFMASRKSLAKPFGAAKKIKAITGFVEAPTISPDGKALYYHKRNGNGVFSIYRVTRP